MATIEQQLQQLYNDVLGRGPDQDGLRYWASEFGPTLDPNEIEIFKIAARPELQNITISAYQNVLGRTPSQSEVDFWINYALNSGVQEASAAFMVSAEREIAGRSPPPASNFESLVNIQQLQANQSNLQANLNAMYAPGAFPNIEQYGGGGYRLESAYKELKKYLSGQLIPGGPILNRDSATTRAFGDSLQMLFDNFNQLRSAYGLTEQQIDDAFEQAVRANSQITQELPISYLDSSGWRINREKLIADTLKNALTPLNRYTAEIDNALKPFISQGENLVQQRVDAFNRMEAERKKQNLQTAIGIAALFAVPFAPNIGAFIAPGASAGVQAAIGGAVIGGGTAAATGQNVIKGALMGALGSITSTTYAEAVGKSLGITSQTAAITVGNAVINAGLSGVQAALTGGDVVKSMIGGAVKGAIIADPAVLANALVGGEANLQRLISGTNLNLEQAQQIITRSIGDAFALSIQGGNFFNLLGEGLVANGISTSVANGINSAIGRNLSDEARMALVVGGQGISDVTVRAVLNNRSISNDLSRASASIVSAGLIAANMTAAEKARLDEIRRNQTVLDSPPLTQVLLASANTGTMSDAINQLGIDGVIQYTNGITAVAPEIIVRGSWLDGWLNTVTSIWNDFSSFLGQYARMQKNDVIQNIIGLANAAQNHYAKFGAGPGGALSTNIEALERVKQNLTRLLSAEATGNRREAYRILKEAEGTGTVNELLSGLRAFAADPRGFFNEATGGLIINLVGGAIASGSSLAARLATQLGINISGAVGNVKQEIYNEVYQSARKAGLSELDAVAMATDAQSYTGRNTDAIALAAAIGGIATLVPGSLEQQIIRKVAAQGALKQVTRAVTAGAIEKVTELVQSLQSGVSANVAINRIPDPRIEMIRQAGVNSEVGREIQRQIDAMPWNRGLLDGNVLGKAILEATTAFAVGTGLSLGLSIQDINRLAIDAAADRGQRVNWEVLDAPTRSDLIIKAFVPPQIIDVVATDITKLLTAPPISDAGTSGGTTSLPGGGTSTGTGTVTTAPPGGSGTGTVITAPPGGSGTSTVTPARPGPSDQNVIDVIDTGPRPITPVTPVTPAPAPAVPAGPTPAQVFETDIGRVRGQEPEILTQVDDPTIQVITAIQNDIDLLISNRNAIIDIFQNLDNATRQELEPVFRRNDQELQQKILDLTQLQDVVIGEVRTELTETARGRRQELDIERFEKEQEEFEKALKELEDAIAKAKSDAEKAQARQLFAVQQRERLQAAGRITGGLQAQIDAELNNLLDQYEDAQRRGRVGVTQKEGLVAPQQPDPSRPVTDEEIMQLTGITPEDASRIGITVPPPGDETPIGGVTPEPDVTEPTPEDEQPPPKDEDKETPLSPIVIYDQPRPRGTPGIPSRVTPEAVTGILGPKEPLFGSDDDPQVALWNRRSLRLRKALGL